MTLLILLTLTHPLKSLSYSLILTADISLVWNWLLLILGSALLVLEQKHFFLCCYFFVAQEVHFPDEFWRWWQQWRWWRWWWISGAFSSDLHVWAEQSQHSPLCFFLLTCMFEHSGEESAIRIVLLIVSRRTITLFVLLNSPAIHRGNSAHRHTHTHRTL